MVKIILQTFPVLPAESPQERAALRPLGRNRERYQETLDGWHEIVQAADALGVWGFATIEHHFHSEGYEVGPNPGVLAAHWAAITKNIRLGQLGYVMSTQNPFRIAEETAIIDHLAKGRSFVGFARGYQDRWTNIVGQHLGARAAHSDGSADDNLNREIFEEQVDLVLKAWTQDSIEHKSPRWQVPYPYEEGIDWWMAESSKWLGAPGEIGDDGKVHRVSVVPKPYQDPHPPVFVASLGSPRSVEYCARKDFVPVYFGPRKRTIEQGPHFQRIAKETNGQDYAIGEHMCLVKNIELGADDQDVYNKIAKHDSDIWMNFINPLSKVLVPENALPDNASMDQIVNSIRHSDVFVAGTVDQVRDQLVREYHELPSEYFCLIMHYAQHPKEDVIRTLETFMKEIKPALDELTPYEKAEPASALARD